MEVLDYIFMGFGALLIVIGLFLFISGKRVDSSNNNVEGFGIKLNVSNPSILLVVLGICLLLVPRFFPTNSIDLSNKVNETTSTVVVPPERTATGNEPISQQQQRSARAGETSVQEEVSPATTNSEDLEFDDKDSVDDATLHTQPNTHAAPRSASQPQAQLFLPTGMWQLTGYQENGVDLSANITGSIYFENTGQGQTSWFADLYALDQWGNTLNYQYQGLIAAANTQYFINTLASNDPSFIAQGQVPLELLLEGNQTLHMAYFYNGSNILLHWQQY